jgi:hypothetical protein
MQRVDDPFIVVAANRGFVKLKDGRVGRLIWWSQNGDKITVMAGGRHVRLHKDDIQEVLPEDG